jgi:anti-sigma factor RsiW
MTACAEYETLLHGLIDGELDAANTFACEQHLASCARCTATLHEIEKLRRKLHATPLAYSATEQLRTGIDMTLAAQRRSTPRSSRLKVLFAAVKPQAWSVAALAAAAAFVFIVFSPPAQDDLVKQIVAGHVRSLQVGHLVDIETSDRHVVKPWFAGKVDFSPPVVDLADRGFELIGGRLDYLDDHAVAALAYRRHAHLINLFVWPHSDNASGNAAPANQAKTGFNLIHWQAGGLTYWAVSDLNLHELCQFQQLVTAQVPQ